jgi:hypothetical protein
LQVGTLTNRKMAELNPNSKFQLTIKELIALGFGISSLLGVYFTLKADIALAMQEPKPVITQQEFQYKDELVRKTIMLTQQEVSSVKEDVAEIKESLNKIEDRLYERR